MRRSPSSSPSSSSESCNGNQQGGQHQDLSDLQQPSQEHLPHHQIKKKRNFPTLFMEGCTGQPSVQQYQQQMQQYALQQQDPELQQQSQQQGKWKSWNKRQLLMSPPTIPYTPDNLNQPINFEYFDKATTGEDGDNLQLNPKLKGQSSANNNNNNNNNKLGAKFSVFPECGTSKNSVDDFNAFHSLPQCNNGISINNSKKNILSSEAVPVEDVLRWKEFRRKQKMQNEQQQQVMNSNHQIEHQNERDDLIPQLDSLSLSLSESTVSGVVSIGVGAFGGDASAGGGSSFKNGAGIFSVDEERSGAVDDIGEEAVEIDDDGFPISPTSFTSSSAVSKSSSASGQTPPSGLTSYEAASIFDQTDLQADDKNTPHLTTFGSNEKESELLGSAKLGAIREDFATSSDVPTEVISNTVASRLLASTEFQNSSIRNGPTFDSLNTVQESASSEVPTEVTSNTARYIANRSNHLARMMMMGESLQQENSQLESENGPAHLQTQKLQFNVLQGNQIPPLMKNTSLASSASSSSDFPPSESSVKSQIATTRQEKAEPSRTQTPVPPTSRDEAPPETPQIIATPASDSSSPYFFDEVSPISCTREHSNPTQGQSSQADEAGAGQSTSNDQAQHHSQDQNTPNDKSKSKNQHRHRSKREEEHGWDDSSPTLDLNQLEHVLATPKDDGLEESPSPSESPSSLPHLLSEKPTASLSTSPSDSPLGNKYNLSTGSSSWDPSHVTTIRETSVSQSQSNDSSEYSENEINVSTVSSSWDPLHVTTIQEADEDDENRENTSFEGSAKEAGGVCIIDDDGFVSNNDIFAEENSAPDSNLLSTAKELTKLEIPPTAPSTSAKSSPKKTCAASPSPKSLGSSSQSPPKGDDVPTLAEVKNFMSRLEALREERLRTAKNRTSNGNVAGSRESNGPPNISDTLYQNESRAMPPTRTQSPERKESDVVVNQENVEFMRSLLEKKEKLRQHKLDSERKKKELDARLKAMRANAYCEEKRENKEKGNEVKSKCATHIEPSRKSSTSGGVQITLPPNTQTNDQTDKKYGGHVSMKTQQVGLADLSKDSNQDSDDVVVSGLDAIKKFEDLKKETSGLESESQRRGIAVSSSPNQEKHIDSPRRNFRPLVPGLQALFNKKDEEPPPDETSSKPTSSLKIGMDEDDFSFRPPSTASTPPNIPFSPIVAGQRSRFQYHFPSPKAAPTSNRLPPSSPINITRSQPSPRNPFQPQPSPITNVERSSPIASSSSPRRQDTDGRMIPPSPISTSFDQKSSDLVPSASVVKSSDSTYNHLQQASPIAAAPSDTSIPSPDQSEGDKGGGLGFGYIMGLGDKSVVSKSSSKLVELGMPSTSFEQTKSEEPSLLGVTVVGSKDKTKKKRKKQLHSLEEEQSKCSHNEGDSLMSSDQTPVRKAAPDPPGMEAENVVWRHDLTGGNKNRSKRPSLSIRADLSTNTNEEFDAVMSRVRSFDLTPRATDKQDEIAQSHTFCASGFKAKRERMSLTSGISSLRDVFENGKTENERKGSNETQGIGEKDPGFLPRETNLAVDGQGTAIDGQGTAIDGQGTAIDISDKIIQSPRPQSQSPLQPAVLKNIDESESGGHVAARKDKQSPDTISNIHKLRSKFESEPVASQTQRKPVSGFNDEKKSSGLLMENELTFNDNVSEERQVLNTSDERQVLTDAIEESPSFVSEDNPSVTELRLRFEAEVPKSTKEIRKKNGHDNEADIHINHGNKIEPADWSNRNGKRYFKVNDREGEPQIQPCREEIAKSQSVANTRLEKDETKFGSKWKKPSFERSPNPNIQKPNANENIRPGKVLQDDGYDQTSFEPKSSGSSLENVADHLGPVANSNSEGNDDTVGEDTVDTKKVLRYAQIFEQRCLQSSNSLQSKSFESLKEKDSNAGEAISSVSSKENVTNQDCGSEDLDEIAAIRLKVIGANKNRSSRSKVKHSGFSSPKWNKTNGKNDFVVKNEKTSPQYRKSNHSTSETAPLPLNSDEVETSNPPSVPLKSIKDKIAAFSGSNNNTPSTNKVPDNKIAKSALKSPDSKTRRSHNQQAHPFGERGRSRDMASPSQVAAGSKFPFPQVGSPSQAFKVATAHNLPHRAQLKTTPSGRVNATSGFPSNRGTATSQKIDTGWNGAVTKESPNQPRSRAQFRYSSPLAHEDDDDDDDGITLSPTCSEVSGLTLPTCLWSPADDDDSKSKQTNVSKNSDVFDNISNSSYSNSPYPMSPIVRHRQKNAKFSPDAKLSQHPYMQHVKSQKGKQNPTISTKTDISSNDQHDIATPKARTARRDQIVTQIANSKSQKQSIHINGKQSRNEGNDYHASQPRANATSNFHNFANKPIYPSQTNRRSIDNAQISNQSPSKNGLQWQKNTGTSVVPSQTKEQDSRKVHYFNKIASNANPNSQGVGMNPVYPPNDCEQGGTVAEKVAMVNTRTQKRSHHNPNIGYQTMPKQVSSRSRAWSSRQPSEDQSSFATRDCVRVD